MKDLLKEQILDRLHDHPQHKYFLDYVTVNLRIQRKIHNTLQLIQTKEIISRFYNFIQNKKSYGDINIIPGWLQQKREEYDYYYGVHFPRSSFNKMYHFITVQFSGRFWAGDVNHKYEPIDKLKNMSERNRTLKRYKRSKITTPRTQKIKDDIKLVYHVVCEIREIIESIQNETSYDVNRKIIPTYPELKGKPILNTVSRIDIATQKRSDLNKGKHTLAPTFHQKNNKNAVIIPYVNTFTNKYSAFSLGKKSKDSPVIDRQKSMFRVYDKEQTTEELNKLICLKRFDSTNFIRKEWELKPEFFGKKAEAHWGHNIRTIEDLMSCILNKTRLRNLISSMRRQADCILYNDGKHYKALHDKSLRKLLKETKHLSGRELDKLYTKIKIPSADYVSDINKVSEAEIQKNKKPWNPFAMIKGMINKHGKNISTEQFQELRDIISSF